MLAIAIDQEKQDDTSKPDRAGEVTLIQVNDLRPNSPEFASIRITRREKIF